MASIGETVRNNIISHIVAVIFTASVTGLFFYFDQRDMKKDIQDLKNWKEKTDKIIENQSAVINSIVGILEAIKEIKKDQTEMKADVNIRFDKMDMKFNRMEDWYYNRVPRSF